MFMLQGYPRSQPRPTEPSPQPLGSSYSGSSWDNLDVAIVGGGPAGLAAAAALLTVAPHLNVKVFEASATYSEQGANVLLQTNGARALEAIDPSLLHRLVSRSTITSGVLQYNDESGEQMPWQTGRDVAAELAANGHANCYVLWNDVRRELYGKLPPGVVEFGCKVVGCTAAPSRAAYLPSDSCGSGLDTASAGPATPAHAPAPGYAHAPPMYAPAAAACAPAPAGPIPAYAPAPAGPAPAHAAYAYAAYNHVTGADGTVSGSGANGAYAGVFNANGAYTGVLDANGTYAGVLDANGAYAGVLDANGGLGGACRGAYSGAANGMSAGSFVLDVLSSSNGNSNGNGSNGDGANGNGGAEGQPRRAFARHVIAADGYFSKIRRTAGDGGAPAFMNMVVWRGSVTRPELANSGTPLPAFLDPFRSHREALTTTHVFVPVKSTAPLRAPPHRLLTVVPMGADARLVWSMAAPATALATALPPRQAGNEGPLGGLISGLNGLFFSEGALGPRLSGNPWEAAMRAPAGSGSPPGPPAATFMPSALSAELPEGGPDDGKGIHQIGTAGPAALRRCLSAFPHLPREVRSLLAATPPGRVTEHELYQHPVEAMVEGAWACGRLLLVGDAAHTAPPDGQGVNLALEDAAVLGDMVRQHGLGPQAFTAWEARRLPRVRGILGDMSPAASTRVALIASAAFTPLWTPHQLTPRAAAGAGGGGGGLPPAVADEAERAEARSAGAGVKVVLAWSRARVRVAVERLMAGRTPLQTVAPPGPAYSLRTV